MTRGRLLEPAAVDPSHFIFIFIEEKEEGGSNDGLGIRLAPSATRHAVMKRRRGKGGTPPLSAAYACVRPCVRASVRGRCGMRGCVPPRAPCSSE